MNLLLLSGGTDSACLAYALRPELCITVNYGQIVANAEIDSSRNICRALGLRHKVIKVDLRSFGAGLMAGGDQKHKGAVAEWWPFRNQFLVTVGAMVAFKYQLDNVVIGTVQSDRRHKDGGAAFLRRMDGLLKFQEGGVRLVAPARNWSAEELVARTNISLSLLGLTFSCHRSNFPCGQCRGCRKNEAVISFAIKNMRERRISKSSKSG